MKKKSLVSRFSRFMNRLLVEAKKIIRSNDNHHLWRALASLFVFVFAISQAVKEVFFKNNLRVSILIFLLVGYVTYSHFDEHVVLTIAMLLCLFFAYDTLTSLIKGEVRNRNDQIYKEFLDHTKEQVTFLSRKRKMIEDLETFAASIEQIKNSSLLQKNKHGVELFNFKPSVELKQSLRSVILEELHYLDTFHSVKNRLIDRTSIESDKDLGFSNSKLEEASANIS